MGPPARSMSAQRTLSVRKEGRWWGWKFWLAGSLDASTAKTLEASIDELSCDFRPFVMVDTREVDDLDECGVNVLSGMSHYVEARGGVFALVGSGTAADRRGPCP